MRKAIFSIMVMFFALTIFNASVYAEVKTLSGHGEYVMGQGDTIQKARDGALAEAMRSCAEQAGVFLESYTKTEQMQVTRDQVIAASGHVMKVTQKSYNKTMTPQGDIHVTCDITAEVDTDNIIKAIKENSTSTTTTTVTTSTTTVEQPPQENIAAADRCLELSIAYRKDGRDKSALEQTYQAIAYAPHYGRCYTVQGNLYYLRGRKDKAVEIWKKGIDIAPNYSYNYSCIGDYYGDLLSQDFLSNAAEIEYKEKFLYYYETALKKAKDVNQLVYIGDVLGKYYYKIYDANRQSTRGKEAVKKAYEYYSIANRADSDDHDSKFGLSLTSSLMENLD